MNIFKKFQIGLNKTSTIFSSSLLSVLAKNKIDQEVIDEIENILLSSDIGIEVTNHLIEKIKSSKLSGKEDTNLVLKILCDEIEQILKSKEKILVSESDNKPGALIFIGVNGSGKTTTIGKVINFISDKKILIGACDTFRAAAVEQLKEWSIKQSVDFYEGKINQDPASVAYNATLKAKSEGYDYVILDTAGRLSNNANLLNQLIKIKTVVEKNINKDDLKIILVLDGTNGSNMIKQVEIFSKSMDVTGLIITKIDGTAKGGALIAIAKKYDLPIHFVGMGEKKEDLLIFNAKNFAESIIEIKK